MSYKLDNIRFDNKVYTVETAVHLFENREMAKGTSKYHRGQHIDESRYKQILTKALYNGLTSFRNKGATVITFKSDKERPFGVLVDLDGNNRIFVITVFRGPKVMDLSRCFIKVGNRINIVNSYTMKAMSDRELNKNKMKKISHESEKNTKSEDALFLRAMKQ